MVVLTTGAEGQPFAARCPFSWEIKQLISAIIDGHIDDNEGTGIVKLLDNNNLAPDCKTFNRRILSFHIFCIVFQLHTMLSIQALGQIFVLIVSSHLCVNS